MIIAVSSSGESPESLLNEHFGRCPFFSIVNTNNMKYESFINPGYQLQNGAGPKAAEFIVNHKVDVLITGSLGDKAVNALNKCNIRICDGYKNTSKVNDAVNHFLSLPNK